MLTLRYITYRICQEFSICKRQFFFGCSHGIWMLSDQGLNPCHSSDPSHCSDNARSSTHCATKKLLQRATLIYNPWGKKDTLGVLWWLSGLRIWCCHCHGLSQIPGLGTFAWGRHGQKKRSGGILISCCRGYYSFGILYIHSLKKKIGTSEFRDKKTVAQRGKIISSKDTISRWQSMALNLTHISEKFSCVFPTPKLFITTRSQQVSTKTLAAV